VEQARHDEGAPVRLSGQAAARAKAEESFSGPAALALQRSAGNAAVAGLVRKLAVQRQDEDGGGGDDGGDSPSNDTPSGPTITTESAVHALVVHSGDDDRRIKTLFDNVQAVSSDLRFDARANNLQNTSETAQKPDPGRSRV